MRTASLGAPGSREMLGAKDLQKGVQGQKEDRKMTKASICSVKIFTQKKIFFRVFSENPDFKYPLSLLAKVYFFVWKVKSQFLEFSYMTVLNKIWRLVWESSTIHIIPFVAKYCAHHPSVPLPH